MLLACSKNAANVQECLLGFAIVLASDSKSANVQPAFGTFQIRPSDCVVQGLCLWRLALIGIASPRTFVLSVRLLHAQLIPTALPLEHLVTAMCSTGMPVFRF